MTHAHRARGSVIASGAIFATSRDAHIAHTFLAATPPIGDFLAPGDNGKTCDGERRVSRETFGATVLTQKRRERIRCARQSTRL
jgi:hypothetical protein